MEILGKGVVQYVGHRYIIISKGRKFYKKKHTSSYLQLWCELPISTGDKLLSFNRWLSRISRKEIHHLLKIKNGIFACFAFGEIYIIQEKTGTVKYIGEIEGSRPLKVCTDGSYLYYGIYTSNKERKSIDLFRYSLEEENWSVFHSFQNIRHIHGVFWDHYKAKVWVTTGDLDYESTIWQFDDLNEPDQIVTGSQQTRAVDLLFTEDAVFYATDAPNDPNFIYRLDRESGKTEQLQKVGSPVFYGRKTDNWLFFSTVVEPSEVNRTDAIELWGSNDYGQSWLRIKEFQKDIGHMKLFQYGQIKFPIGPGDGKNLWFTPYATEHDHRIIKMPLNSL